MKKFAVNFVISLVVYFVINYLWLVVFAEIRPPFVLTSAPRIIPIWVQVIHWVQIPISMFLYFYLGTKLNLLGNHLLNFLSASGGFVFGLYMMYLGSYALILPQLSFPMIGALIFENTNNLYIAITVVSILPTLLIWLGMFYKSRKA